MTHTSKHTTSDGGFYISSTNALSGVCADFDPRVLSACLTGKNYGSEVVCLSPSGLIGMAIALTSRSSSVVRMPKVKNYRLELIQLALLEDDWDGYGAKRPTAEVLMRAEDVLGVCDRLEMVPDGVGPLIEGGIEVKFVSGDRYCNIVIQNDSKVVVHRFQLNGDLDVHEVVCDDRVLEQEIRGFVEYLAG